MSRKNAHTKDGESIRGEQIMCEARDIPKSRTVQHSSNHRIQRVVIDKDAYCVITKPERWIQK